MFSLTITFDKFSSVTGLPAFITSPVVKVTSLSTMKYAKAYPLFG